MVDLECPFCKIVQGADPQVSEVWRDESAVIFFPDEPITLGHCLVVPVEHSEAITGLGYQQIDRLFELVQSVAHAVEATISPDGINIIQSNGRAATQTIDHVHVHVVPRWDDDEMGNFWPKSPMISDLKKEQMRERLLIALSVENEESERPNFSEEELYHLSFIQNVIGRMSTASAQVKTWMLPVVIAIYGYAIAQESDWALIAGIFAVLIFAYLDLRYIEMERQYRKLYEALVANTRPVPRFTMDSDEIVGKVTVRDRVKLCWSWAFAPVYGAMLLVAFLVFCSVRGWINFV